MYKLNMIEHSKAESNYCPFKNGRSNLRCSGKGCMAYVTEYHSVNNQWKSQDDILETGFGWCGMIQPQSGDQVKVKLK